MATKEKVKKPSTAVAKVKPTAVVSVQDAIAKELAELGAATGSASAGRQILVTQNKMFRMPDGREHPGPFKAVIVDHVTRRKFYDRVFDRKNPCPPACAASSREVAGMVPMQGVPDKQANDCTGCPNNMWGSAAQGDGKACKESRYLALIPEDADATTELSFLELSPTALKPFDSYAKSVASSLQLPLFGVVTTIGFDPNKDFPSVICTTPEPASQDLVQIAANLKAAARQELLAPIDFSGYKPVSVKKGKK
jgi:hypothetical protein